MLVAANRRKRAKIEGAGSSRIVIEGVKELHGAEHEVIPDRIEAGTFLIAGAIAGKEVTINRVRSDHLTAVTDALRACGYGVGGTNGTLTIHANGIPEPLDLKTRRYPGDRVYHIDRGYEMIDQKLGELGAHIERVNGIVRGVSQRSIHKQIERPILRSYLCPGNAPSKLNYPEPEKNALML